MISYYNARVISIYSQQILSDAYGYMRQQQQQQPLCVRL